VVPATFRTPVIPIVVVAAKGVVGAVGVTETVIVAADDNVVVELLVVAFDVPKVPRLHTMPTAEPAPLQFPVPEPVPEVPALVTAESSEPAVPKLEAVNNPPFTGSPVL